MARGPLRIAIEDFINTFNPGDALHRWLARFVSDPLAVTYAVIRDTFVTFFCYVMARALGTEQEQLPPPPVWWK